MDNNLIEMNNELKQKISKAIYDLIKVEFEFNELEIYLSDGSDGTLKNPIKLDINNAHFIHTIFSPDIQILNNSKGFATISDSKRGQYLISIRKVENPTKNINELDIGNKTVDNVLTTVKALPIMTEDNVKFLFENKEHLGKVLECTYMWRTGLQKISIINDVDFPTLHSKFHQAILEQKVQFDNSMFLAKDFEDLKLDIELLECDLEDLEKETDRRSKIKAEKIKLDISFKKYQLENMRIAMEYRMKEVRGWQDIENALIKEMKDHGMNDDQIWNKEEGELRSSFFVSINRLSNISRDANSSEMHNIITMAIYNYTQALNAGKLEEFKKDANEKQLEAIKVVENSLNK